LGVRAENARLFATYPIAVPKVMFKRKALYLAVLAGLALGNVSNAIQPGFLGNRGEVKTFPFKGTVIRVNGTSLKMERTMFHAEIANHLEAIFTLSPQTVYMKGSYANLVRGAKAKVFFHFDPSNSDIAYADEVQFYPK
jgi:hypothetical protein